MIDDHIESDGYQKFLQDQSADETERKERETFKHLELLHPFRRDLIEQKEQLLEPVADQYGDAEDGDMECQRVDRIAENGLLPGRRLCMARIDAAPFIRLLFREKPHIFHPAAPDRQIDERHTDDNAEHHAGGRHRITQVPAARPVEMIERGGETGHGAVPAFEADFQQCAECPVDVEERNQHQSGQGEPDHILPPGDQLSVAELGRGKPPDLPQAGQGGTDEERGEDDVDEEPGDVIPAGIPVGREVFPEGVDPDEPDQSSDDGSGQIETLQQRNRSSDGLAENQQQTEAAEGHYGSHDSDAPWGMVRTLPDKIRNPRRHPVEIFIRRLHIMNGKCLISSG